jgi:acetyl-CoA C-acetyltransferase
LLADSIGAAPREQFTTGVGGQVGLQMLNHLAVEIAAGRSRIALLAGCNNLKVLMGAIKQGVRLSWQRGGDGEARLFGGDEPGSSALEGAHGLSAPPDIYPLFENALRARDGIDLETHRQRMGELFAPMTDVAVDNPYAWFRTRRSASDLTTVTASNRMIAFPYSKYLNAILNTEQAAGLVVYSASAARALGIDESEWVCWWGVAQSEKVGWWASERPDFAACPSMLDTHVSALVNAGIGIDDVELMDFYSCFPSAAEIAVKMLGLSARDARGFIVTGGLPYAGGPASAYTLHSGCEMVARLRGRDARGLVTGNGWYLTKHSASVLSGTPPTTGAASGLIDPLPSMAMPKDACPVEPNAEGSGQVLTYTVKYDRDGKPERGIVIGEMGDGRRFLANTSSDIGLLEDFVAVEQVGRQGRVAAGKTCEFLPA